MSWNIHIFFDKPKQPNERKPQKETKQQRRNYCHMREGIFVYLKRTTILSICFV